MLWLTGKTCVRCGNERTREKFEGIPTCDSCEMKTKVSRENTRHCPIDGREMKKEVVKNVIIDRCPSCTGVWLDGGELDLITKAIGGGEDGDFATGMMLGILLD